MNNKQYKEYVWNPEEFRKYYESMTHNNLILESLEVRKNNLLIECLDIKKTDVVLDIGCGYGRIAKILLPHAGTIMGVDLNPHNLEYAQRYLNSPNFNSIQLDISHGNLPLESNSIDKIVAENILMFFNENQLLELFCEFKRVLRKDGIIVFNYLNVFYPLNILEIILEYMHKKLGRKNGNKYYYSHFHFNKIAKMLRFKTQYYGESFYTPLRVKGISLIPNMLNGFFIKMDEKNNSNAIKYAMRSLTCIYRKRDII